MGEATGNRLVMRTKPGIEIRSTTMISSDQDRNNYRAPVSRQRPVVPARPSVIRLYWRPAERQRAPFLYAS